MCAGSAQVTLVELRKSCYPGCNPTERQNKKTPKQPKTKNHNSFSLSMELAKLCAAGKGTSSNI